jgi:hypothetical protein
MFCCPGRGVTTKVHRHGNSVSLMLGYPLSFLRVKAKKKKKHNRGKPSPWFWVCGKASKEVKSNLGWMTGAVLFTKTCRPSSSFEKKKKNTLLLVPIFPFE